MQRRSKEIIVHTHSLNLKQPPTTEDLSKLNAMKIEYSRGLNQLPLHIHNTQKRILLSLFKFIRVEGVQYFPFRSMQVEISRKVNVRASRERRVSDKIKESIYIVMKPVTFLSKYQLTNQRTKNVSPNRALFEGSEHLCILNFENKAKIKSSVV